MNSQAAFDRELIAESDAVRAARARERRREQVLPHAISRVRTFEASIANIDNRLTDPVGLVGVEVWADWLRSTKAETDAELAAPRPTGDYWESMRWHARRDVLLARVDDIQLGFDAERGSDLLELAQAAGVTRLPRYEAGHVLTGRSSLPRAERRISELRAERERLEWGLAEARESLAVLEAED